MTTPLPLRVSPRLLVNRRRVKINHVLQAQMAKAKSRWDAKQAALADRAKGSGFGRVEIPDDELSWLHVPPQAPMDYVEPADAPLHVGFILTRLPVVIPERRAVAWEFSRFAADEDTFYSRDNEPLPAYIQRTGQREEFDEFTRCDTDRKAALSSQQFLRPLTLRNVDPVSRVSTSDLLNYRKLPARRFDRKLYLLVRDAKSATWGFPAAPRTELSDSTLLAAERLLLERGGRSLTAIFRHGLLPCVAYLDNDTSELDEAARLEAELLGLPATRSAAALKAFHQVRSQAVYVSGKPNFESLECDTFAWVTRQEFREYVWSSPTAYSAAYHGLTDGGATFEVDAYPNATESRDYREMLRDLSRGAIEEASRVGLLEKAGLTEEQLHLETAKALCFDRVLDADPADEEPAPAILSSPYEDAAFACV